MIVYCLISEHVHTKDIRLEGIYTRRELVEDVFAYRSQMGNNYRYHIEEHSWDDNCPRWARA